MRDRGRHIKNAVMVFCCLVWLLLSAGAGVDSLLVSGTSSNTTLTAQSTKPANFQVEYDRSTDLLSIQARQAPLGKILQEISQKAHVTIDSPNEELLIEQVSVEMNHVSLEQAIKQLLREFNSAFIYSSAIATDDKTPKPSLVKVVLLSKKAGVLAEDLATKEKPTPKPTVSHGAELVRAVIERNSGLVKGIVEALKEPGRETEREKAVEALLETLKDRNFPAHDDVIAALKKLSADKAADALTNWLQGDDPQISMRAAMALGRLGNEKAVDELRLALTGKDPLTRQAVASSLAQIGGDKAIATLLGHLSHPDVEIRRAVIAAISESDDGRAVEVLASVVAHETDVEGRKLAAFYLVEREGERAIAPLTTALRDNDTRVRLFAVAFAGRLGKSAEPLLTEALTDPAPEVRATAASWLDSLRKRK